MASANNSKLKDHVLFSATTTENILIFKNESDYKTWKTTKNNKEYLIKLFKSKKLCSLPQKSFIVAMRNINDLSSFYINVPNGDGKCEGLINESYLHTKLTNIKKIKKDKKENLFNYYKTLDAKEIAKDLADTYSRSAPFRMDKLTVLKSAYSLDNTLHINKSIEAVNLKEEKNLEHIFINKNMFSEFSKYMLKQDADVVCHDKISNLFFEKQGSLVYNYQIYINDRMVKRITNTIDKSTCNSK
jgi:hypothetical protein